MKKDPKKRSPKKLLKLSSKKSLKIDRRVPRFWGLATRLEHRRIKGKKSSK